MQTSLFNIVTNGHDEWLTPPEIIRALGTFDLDPCSPINRPWPTAKQHYTLKDDGLIKIWNGRVWLNPPYGNACQLWMERMSKHGNGIALIFARTDTAMFQKYVFDIADSILFMKGRLTFYNVDGTPGKHNGGAPSALIAYGQHNSQAISQSKIEGKHLPLNSVPIVVVGISPSWRSVVEISLKRIGTEADLDLIYRTVEQIAPDKVSKNRFYKEKIRQQLQHSFTQIRKGIWAAA